MLHEEPSSSMLAFWQRYWSTLRNESETGGLILVLPMTEVSKTATLPLQRLWSSLANLIASALLTVRVWARSLLWAQMATGTLLSWPREATNWPNKELCKLWYVFRFERSNRNRNAFAVFNSRSTLFGDTQSSKISLWETPSTDTCFSTEPDAPKAFPPAKACRKDVFPTPISPRTAITIASEE